MDGPGHSGAVPRASPLHRPWLVVWTVLAGAFAVGVNFTILAVSRPAIAMDLGVDPTTLVWLISGPILANAMATATAGKLGDLRGHRGVYLVGMIGTVLATLASALAPNAPALVAIRVLGAVVGAATGPSSMAIINLTFEPERRARALGFWSLVGAGGPVVGLVIGGWLVDALGWRAIFWAQVPLLIIATLLAWRVLPSTARSANTAFDVRGNVVLSLGLVAILVAAERGRTWGWASPMLLGLVTTGVLLLVVFVRVERSAESPLIPTRYFSRRGFVVPLLVLLFAQFGYMGGFILAPKLLVELDGRTAAQTSLLLVPRPLTFAVAGVAAGFFGVRVGARAISALGGAAVSASLFAMAWVVDDISVGVVMAAIALSGLGMGAVQPSLGATVANSVDDDDLGVAGATLHMAAQVATSLGMNLLDSIQASLVPGLGAVGSYRSAYIVGGVITSVTVLLAMAMPTGKRHRHTASTPP